ncbi:MAG: hypothetical protein M1450_01795 [Patescibacteria group bacterium]|nr:hypothetical protein [Patescibacteria group bacterium]
MLRFPGDGIGPVLSACQASCVPPTSAPPPPTIPPPTAPPPLACTPTTCRTSPSCDRCDSNGVWQNDYSCGNWQTCFCIDHPTDPTCTAAPTPTPGGACIPSLTATASCNASNVITASGVPSSNADDHIQFTIRNSAGTTLCKLPGGSGNGVLGYTWNGKGCGTITSDPLLGIPEVNPAQTTFNATTVQRNSYYVYLTVYTYNSGNTAVVEEGRCKYRVGLDGTITKLSLGTLTPPVYDCSTNTRLYFVEPNGLTASKNASNNLVFNYTVIKTNSALPNAYYANISLAYPGNPDNTAHETSLCYANRGARTDASNGCTNVETIQGLWGGPWWYYTNSFTGALGITTFTGVAGTTYGVRVESSNDTGSCGILKDVSVTCPAPTYSISGTVYVDRDHNGVKGTTDTGIVETFYDGRAPYGNPVITIKEYATGTPVSATITYNTTNGVYTISGLAPNAYDVTLDPPTGYEATSGTCLTSGRLQCRSTTSIRQIRVTNANITGKDFGMTPLHTVTGTVFNDLNRNTIQDTGELALNPTSTWSITNGTSGTYSYAGSGVYNITNALSTVPQATPNQILIGSSTYSVTSVNPRNVTIPESYTPSTTTVNFGLIKNSVSGYVYLDANGNRRKDTGEQNYAASVCFSGSTSGCITSSTATGYSFSNLSPGAYTIYVPAVPGYYSTYPAGSPSTYNIILGTSPPCSFSPNDITGPSCLNGNITNLNFGLNNETYWFQGQGGDMRVDTGFSDPIPGIAAPYASIPRTQGGTAGIVFSGNSTPYFGNGQASSNKWQAGNGINPETFSPTSGIRTSYAYVTNTVLQAGLSYNTLACTYTNCTLPVNLANGVYKIDQSLSLDDPNSTTLPRPTYTFSAGKNYVFLVNGDLTINTNIVVPIGSTATFIVNGNITVKKGVTDLQGIYSTDKNFVIEGASTCPSSDSQLTIQGSVIVNVGLSTFSLINNRNLCLLNETTPAYVFVERPDFLLNLPQLIRVENRAWQEMVP